jgi:hypothetical protein
MYAQQKSSKTGTTCSAVQPKLQPRCPYLQAVDLLPQIAAFLLMTVEPLLQLTHLGVGDL